MKYIVDTDDFEPLFDVDSIGVFGIGKSLSDSDKDHSWSRIKSIEEFEELNADYVNENFGDLQDTAYQKGLEDGKKAFDLLGAERDSEYQRGITFGKVQGQNEAWNCAKRIILHPDNGGMTCTEILAAFGEASVTNVLYKCSAQQAIEKLKAYEEKKSDDEIKVKDEVVWTQDENVAIVVTRVYTVNNMEWCDGICQDGKVYHILTENARKTGRRFDIDKILEEMKK